MFYKLDSGILLFGKVVTSPTFELTTDTKNKFTYPIDEWYWFDTDEDAYLFFEKTYNWVATQPDMVGSVAV